MEMKRGFGFIASIVVLFFIFLFLFSSFVTASCSIGATPLGVGAKVKPGTTVEVDWNFYNLYGDRATHITVSKISGPDWTITYDPALHVQAYDVSGVIQNQTENLAIENTSVVLTIPAVSPDGISYVKHPSLPGYIPVKQIKIYIKVPDNAKLGQNYGFVFQGEGNCFTEPGAVIPAAALQLKVNITTANDVFYEKPVANNTGITGSTVLGSGTINTILLITSIVLAIILVILLIRGIRKSNKRKMRDAGTIGMQQSKSDFSY